MRNGRSGLAGPGIWRGWTGWLLALCLAVLTACSDSPSPTPQITVQPSDTSVVAGQTATLSVLASGQALSYQWQISTDGGATWTPIAGATQPSFTTSVTTTADSGKLYRVLVTGGGLTVTSSPVRLTVTPAVVAPSLTVQPAAQSVTAPAVATFSVTASGTTPTYQWQRSTDGGTTWANIAGATAASYSTGATTVAMSGERYRVVVSNSAGTVTSTAVALNVSPAPAAPAISVQPSNQSATVGGAAVFTVTVTGQPAPTLQWQRSTNGATWTDIGGANAASYNTGAVTLAQSGELYRVVATNASGSATSTAATLTVNPAPAAPAITTQPAPQSVIAPAPATFTAAASGVPTPTWQWQVSTDGGTTYSNIVGATSATYTTPATTAADDGKRYRAVASNASGSATSDGAPLTVTTAVAFLYEGFAYPASETLNGKNGGTGWSSAWSVVDGNGFPVADSVSGYIVTGLNYTDAAGNALVVSGGAWQTDPGVAFGQARRQSTVTTGAAGTTRWMSFLVKQTVAPTGVDYAAIAPGTGYSFGSPAIASGIGNGTAFANCFYCQSVGVTSPISGWGPGSVAMVLVKIDFAPSGNDSVSVWINPPLAGPLPAATVSSSTLANFDEVLSGMTLAWGDNRSFIFDELRLGETREAVSPYIPPSNGTVAFSIDFESPLPGGGIIDVGGAAVEGVQGFAGLGPTGNKFGGTFLRGQTGNVVTITLNNLPPHQWLSLDFLFAAIDSLDGTGSYPAGDFFRVTVDGVDVFRESFANADPNQIQSYVPPPGVQLARHQDLGFSVGQFWTDSAYWLGGDPVFQRIPHTASSVTITLRLEGVPQGLSDESWAIDNFRVIVGP